MRNRSILSLLLLVSLAPTVRAAETHAASKHKESPSTKQGMLAPSDKAFITNAAAAGKAEVDLGELATGKAENADVKSFAQMMVTDHTGANEKLKALAESKGAAVEPSLDAKHKAARAKLDQLSGAEFDRTYMTDMVGDHEKAVRDFEAAAKTAKDPDVKAFASDTLPTLKTHLEKARATQHGLMGASHTGEASGTSHAGKRY